MARQDADVSSAMKRRAPWLYYAGGWLSGGVLLFAWPFLMARDVNRKAANYVPRLGALTVVYAFIAVAYFGLVGYQMYRVAAYDPGQGLPFQMVSGPYLAILLFLALGLFTLPAYLVARIARYLRARGRTALGGLSSIVLFICYGISLPLLQRKLNEEWKAQPNTSVNTDATP